MQAQDLRFFAASEVVVIGQDGEMADYDNPRGEIHGVAAYVVAEMSDGRRFVSPFGKTSRWEEDALPAMEKQAAALGLRAISGKLPINFSTWREIRPCYGSDAYGFQGIEADDAQREREEECF